MMQFTGTVKRGGAYNVTGKDGSQKTLVSFTAIDELGNAFSCQMWPDDPQQAELIQVIGSAIRQPVSFEVVGYTVRMRDMPDGNGGKKQVPQANFAGGHLGLDLNSIIALGRGLFLEALIGLIFPVGVGVFALLDVSHLVDELLRSTAQLDNRALHVVRSDIHRTGFLRELKKAAKKAQSQYKQICEADADTMVTKVRNGDLSFDTDKLRDLPAAQSSVTRISPAAPTTPLLTPGARPAGGPVPLQPAPINGQFGPASPLLSGTTQHINVPPAASLPTQPQGMLGRFANWLGGN